MARKYLEAAMKPFSEASEENKQPILEILKRYLMDSKAVLEIGSGTGQHAIFFAQQFAHLNWYATDRADHLPGIQLWLAEHPADNLHGPFELDVNQTNWPVTDVDTVFSANTTHIMHWPDVESMFHGVSRLLPTKGLFCLYGPFNYQGQHTSESNARFDQFLRQRDPESGLRDMDDLVPLAEQSQLQLLADHTMPVNNRFLIWQKQ